MIARRLLLLAPLTLLPGCGAVSALGRAATPLDAFDLRAPDMQQAGRMLNRGLSIEPPTTSGALDTDRILIRPNPVQAQYLPDGRWSDKVPALVQTLMLRSFEDTGALSYVGRRPLGGSGDLALVTEITDWQAEQSADGGALVRLRLVARMVREMDASVLARRSFVQVAPAASTGTLDLVTAFNAASDALLTDLVRWGLGSVGVRV
jgi:cholesterol transport system auxiliary component